MAFKLFTDKIVIVLVKLLVLPTLSAFTLSLAARFGVFVVALALVLFVDDEAFANLSHIWLAVCLCRPCAALQITHLSGLLLIVVVFFLVARIFESTRLFLLAALATSLIIKGLVVLLAIELGLARDEIAHGGAHGDGLTRD